MVLPVSFDKAAVVFEPIMKVDLRNPKVFEQQLGAEITLELTWDLPAESLCCFEMPGYSFNRKGRSPMDFAASARSIVFHKRLAEVWAKEECARWENLLEARRWLQQVRWCYIKNIFCSAGLANLQWQVCASQKSIPCHRIPALLRLGDCLELLIKILLNSPQIF